MKRYVSIINCNREKVETEKTEEKPEGKSEEEAKEELEDEPAHLEEPVEGSVEKSTGNDEEDEKKDEKTQAKSSIIELANNADFSVATIAKEANRIKERDEDEIFISLH